MGNNQDKSPESNKSLKAAFKLANSINDTTKKQSLLQGGIMLASTIVTVTALMQNNVPLAMAITNACFISNNFMSRKYNVTLRDNFNEEVQVLGEESREQLQPIEELLEGVENHSIKDINPIELYKKEPMSTVISGLAFLFMPIVFPAIYASTIGKDDVKHRQSLYVTSQNISNTMKNKHPDLTL